MTKLKRLNINKFTSEPLTVIDPDLKFRLRRQLKEINQKYRSTLI